MRTSRADNISFNKVVMISNITEVDRCRYLYPQIPIRLTLTAHQQPFTSSEHLHFGKICYNAGTKLWGEIIR